MVPAKSQVHFSGSRSPKQEKSPIAQEAPPENRRQISFNATSCFSGFKSSTHLTLNLGEHPSQSPVYPGRT